MPDEHLITGADFDALFTAFEHSAFRLETREAYYEADELNLFLQGGPDAVPANFLEDWFSLIRDHVSHGRSVKRVRVVSEPHSDYTRFGLWLSGKNVAAGEDIRYLPRNEAIAVDLPNLDYWLFDDSQLYYVLFDDDNNLLGARHIETSKDIDQARGWRDIAWSIAIPRQKYAAESAGA